MQEFNTILVNSRKDDVRWNIIKHQIMDADKCGRIPGKASFSVAWKRVLKNILCFSFKVKYSIVLAEMLSKHAFNSCYRIFELVNLKECYV